MRELGYEFESASASPARLAATVLGLPIATVRALRAHRSIRGPLLPYLAKRLGG